MTSHIPRIPLGTYKWHRIPVFPLLTRFQSYIQSLYGSHRAARIDITNMTTDLLHIISRCALDTTCTFLFDYQRCVSSEECLYLLLKTMKDGYASAPGWIAWNLYVSRPLPSKFQISNFITATKKPSKYVSKALERCNVYTFCIAFS